MSSQPPPFNSYASPQAHDVAFSPHGVNVERTPGTVFDGLWREGKLLVMHRDAKLPDICVKTNQPANGDRMVRRLQWYPLWIAIFIRFGFLIFLILMLVLQKKATIEIGVSEAARRRRRRGILIGLGVIYLAVAIGVIPAFLLDGDQVSGLTIAAGSIAFVVGLVIIANAAALVKATKITNTHIWLAGVHPDFLARLPGS